MNSDFELNISFPLDDDGFFRRECPFCRKEFKVLLEKEELMTLAQKGIDSFMTEPKDMSDMSTDSDESHSTETEFFCPYCGQCASSDSWWTREQLAYINIFAGNIVANLLNKHLINPLRRNFGRHVSGPISISFDSQEMKQEEPWISPEVNDMEVFDLPCCQRKTKIEENWKSIVHCFFCGFPHPH